MPQRRTSIKDLRQSAKRHARNLDIKSDLKRAMKGFIAAAKTKKATAKELLGILYKKLDKATNSKLIHANTAANRKSRFAKMLPVTKSK